MTRYQWRSSLPPDLLVLSIRRDEAENATEATFQVLYIITVLSAH